MDKEKRESNRVKVRVPVKLQSQGSKSPIRTETADLSLTGFYMEMIFNLDVGTPLDIKLQIGDTTVLAIGRVVTSEPTVGMGFHSRRCSPRTGKPLRYSCKPPRHLSSNTLAALLD
jgi:hypothetical protein